MSRRFRFLTVMALALAIASPSAGATPPRVYILLVDGLDAHWVTPEFTPTLWDLAHGQGTFYPEGRAVMPSVTNTNHAAIITGTYAEANGVVGNMLWDRAKGQAPRGSAFASGLTVETLFTVIESERPQLTTAGVFGKARLVDLFAAVPKMQQRPDVLWGDLKSDADPIDPTNGFASDQRTMDELLSTLALHDPDLVFAALPDVDRTSHAFGPDSTQARKAVLEVDRQIGRLVGALQSRGSWGNTVLMITADHGFVSVEPDRKAGRLYPLVLFGRELLRAGLTDVTAWSSGGIEGIYLPAVPTALEGTDADRLAAVRALALAQPEIAEAWYRLPNPADGGDAFTLATAHPDWRMTHPRIGELLVVAKPGHFFGDPYRPSAAGYSGSHGGPAECRIPIVITGGDPRVRKQIIAPDAATPAAANPDLGATAAWLLGVRAPRGVDGKKIAPELSGRVLREAFE